MPINGLRVKSSELVMVWAMGYYMKKIKNGQSSDKHHLTGRSKH